MIFECDKCGICCRHIDQIPQLKQFDLGNGQCIHLSVDNLCDIYLHRTEICNVDKMYELHFKDKMSRQEYLALNYEGCRDLKKRFS